MYHLWEDFVLCKNATIHQQTTMLSTSENALFPGHSHLLTTGADDPTLFFDYHPSASEADN